MKWILRSLLFMVLSATAPAHAICTIEAPVIGPVGPATLDVLERVQKKAEQNKCDSILLLINTPGGAVDSTRKIVENILNSKRPVLCLVYPDGGHAGSAGAILLQACHVNGALTGTNLGAATPIMGTGESIPEDLRKKMLNDMTSWMDSLTGLRRRNAAFGRDIIVDAKAVTAEEAHRLKAIDFLVNSKSEFLEKAGGREVAMTEKQIHKVQVGDVIPFELDTRFQILSFLSDPQIAYLLFLGSLALLYFEFTHPGTLIAGVSGGLGLILAMIALHKLNVEWGGLLLILLGIALLIAEMFVPSFGALGVGGITAFIVGSLFLFDPVKTGYAIPLSTVVIATLVFGGLFLGIGLLVLKTLRLRRKLGVEEQVGGEARVASVQSDSLSGFVEQRGEMWAFTSDEPVTVGQMVDVVEHSGLVLKVKRKNKESSC